MNRAPGSAASIIAAFVVLGALGAVVVLTPGFARAASPPTCTVRVLHENGDFDAIQLAINSNPGGVICVSKNSGVASGYWPEQLTISTPGTTLRGAGPGLTIIEPTNVGLDTYDYDTATSVGNYSSLQPMMADILVDNTTGVTIWGITVNGVVGADRAAPTCGSLYAGNLLQSPQYAGVDFQNSSGTLTNSAIENVGWSGSTCPGAGLGVYAYNGYAYTGQAAPVAVTVSHTTVTDYQKSGVTCDDPGVNCDVQNDTVVGLGPTTSTPVLADGIIVGEGATANVLSNRVSENDNLGSSNDWWTGYQSAGILAYNAGTGTNISGNHVALNQIGISFQDNGAYDAGTGQLTMFHNSVNSSAAYGIVANGAPGDIGNLSSNNVNNKMTQNTTIWGAPGILVDTGTFMLWHNHIMGSEALSGASNGANQTDPPGNVTTAAIQATSESNSGPTTVYLSGESYGADTSQLATLAETGGSVTVIP
jgi:hypothetical protein